MWNDEIDSGTAAGRRQVGWSVGIEWLDPALSPGFGPLIEPNG